MSDETNFSTWKDFAIHMLNKYEDIADDLEQTKKNYDDLNVRFIEFKTKVYTVIATATTVLGLLELFFKFIV